MGQLACGAAEAASLMPTQKSLSLQEATHGLTVSLDLLLGHQELTRILIYSDRCSSTKCRCSHPPWPAGGPPIPSEGRNFSSVRQSFLYTLLLLLPDPDLLQHQTQIRTWNSRTFGQNTLVHSGLHCSMHIHKQYSTFIVFSPMSRQN